RRDFPRALLWFTKALQTTAGDEEREHNHRLRIAAVLERVPKLRQFWLLNDVVGKAALSPDGTRLVTADGSAGSRQCARLWDPTGKQLAANPLHEGTIREIMFSADARRVLTASYERLARVTDVQTGKLIGEFHAPQEMGVLYAAALSPDGKRGVVAGAHFAQMRGVGGRQAVSPRLEHRRDRVEGVLFSPDGGKIVTLTEDRTARVWDVPTGQPVPVAFAGKVRRAAFSPDGRRIVFSDGSRTAQFSDGSRIA